MTEQSSLDTERVREVEMLFRDKIDNLKRGGPLAVATNRYETEYDTMRYLLVLSPQYDLLSVYYGAYETKTLLVTCATCPPCATATYLIVNVL